jgi:hypothetical protein
MSLLKRAHIRDSKWRLRRRRERAASRDRKHSEHKRAGLVLAAVVGLALVVVAGPSIPAQAQQPLPELKEISRPFNPLEYSEGYVLGHAVNPSSEGLLIKFFQAQVLLGVNSVPAGILNEGCLQSELAAAREAAETDRIRRARERARARSEQNPDQPLNGNPSTDAASPIDQREIERRCTEPINPFVFSSYNTSWLGEFRRESGEPLSLFRFHAWFVHPFLASPFVIKKITPVKSDYILPSLSLDQSANFLMYSRINYGVSQYDGRVVVASQDGVIRRRFRIIMQLGAGGGKFVDLNVPTRELFNYIVSAMATGRLLRVHFFTLYSPQALPSNLLRGYGTNLRVYRVDVLD